MPPPCTNCGKPTKYSARPTLVVITPRRFDVKPGYVPACGDFIEGKPPTAGCVLDPGHAGDHRDTWGGTWSGPAGLSRSLAQRYDQEKDVTTVTAIGAIHDYYCEGCSLVALDRLQDSGFKTCDLGSVGGMNAEQLAEWRARFDPPAPAEPATAEASSTPAADVEGARQWNGGKCLAHGVTACVACWVKAGRPGPEP